LLARSGAALKAKRRPPAAKEIAFPNGGAKPWSMTKLCITAGVFVGGYVGGYACSSLGMMAEVIASGIGSMAGVYLGWKLARWIER